MSLLSQPEDYGLSPAETLAHTADPQLPHGFEPYWRQLREAAAAAPRSGGAFEF